MKIIVTDTPSQAFEQAADMIAAEIRASSTPVLGLATGRTMESIYRILVRQHEAGTLDFSSTTSFNLDEYAGLPATDPNSYHRYMHERLFAHVNMPARGIHVPDGVAPDLDAECAGYENAIRTANGIGLQLLGIGETGHIGFNEPPSAFDSRTRVVKLDAITRRQNSSMFDNDPEQVPSHALTMGVGTILEARRLLLVAVGAGKADIIDKALNGPVSEAISATAVRLHDNATIILDKASSAVWAKNRA
ncbi:glucosamine-6-phosphate deaminase [Gluconobacter kanchanaburiensis]|uniref:Glucosamine-6-phosphate deaminase n=1 Tax=Gluconobacter kanchanaburiensis NBRC 103587 TaxID=1307948 RepID=A0A511B6A7_9PROT|nr:glucosamine-6-phosphate deaminase [Gluconobacter kanchanaburiensis]MBF0861535.1 glucosamine-6-phosphate deaminase [Gluconobacter kanchanaburiensis]GBR66925.1 6-phosphogluconolactonase [Gluconobacter kanchanaburiensis NBRC 103587]GEK95171.1 putative glucosamine-6-phosphate deaminase 2 [Gluconobacter kanchanaburiensis NBRC 103587]